MRVRSFGGWLKSWFLRNFFFLLFFFRSYMYSAKSSGVLSDGWMVFCIVPRCLTHISLSLSLGMGSVLAGCVCGVSYRLCHVMSCHICGRTSTYLPTDLLATLHLLILQWTKTNLLLALALAFDCNFIQLRCVPFSMQCSPIHPCMHANI